MGALQTTGLRRVSAVRYVVPLREGGSLPGLIAALDAELPPRWSRNNPIDLAGGETKDTIPAVLAMEQAACMHPSHAWSDDNYRSSLASGYWVRVVVGPDKQVSAVALNLTMKQTATVPVAICARNKERLDSGLAELLARIRAQLRHNDNSAMEVREGNGLRLDTSARQVP